jgi:hypothetical protein
MENAFELIRKKRSHQIKKGYTAGHDDKHIHGEIVTVYADNYLSDYKFGCDNDFIEGEYNISSSIDDLVNAGACIVAEIERLQRLNNK